MNSVDENVSSKNVSKENNGIIGVGDWLVTLLVVSIPLIGLILLLILAFSSSTNRNKSNWAKATLVWLVFLSVIYTVLIFAFGAFFLSLLPTEENIKRDIYIQEQIKEEADSTASEKLDNLEEMFDEDLGEGVDADTLGL